MTRAGGVLHLGREGDVVVRRWPLAPRVLKVAIAVPDPRVAACVYECDLGSRHTVHPRQIRPAKAGKGKARRDRQMTPCA